MDRHTLSVFTYEIKRNLQRKGFLFTTFGIPVIAFVIFFGFQLISGSSSPEEQISSLQEIIEDTDNVTGYVDLSGAFPAPAPSVADRLISFPNEDAAREALHAGDIHAYYVLAQDYLETGDVRMVIPTFSTNTMFSSSQPLQNLVYGSLVETIQPDILLRVINPVNISETTLQVGTDDGISQTDDGQYWVVYVFAMIFVMALFSTNGYLMQSVIEEKETRLIEILISSVRPGQLLRGKVLAMGLLGLLQIGVWLASMAILSQLALRSSTFADTFIAGLTFSVSLVPLLVVYFVLGYLLFAAVYAAIGALSVSMSEGPSWSVVVVIPAMIPFFFINTISTSPNAFGPVFLSIFPITAPMGMVMRLAMTSVPFIQIAASVVLLMLTVWLFMWMAGRLFRMHTLLAGQMPKLKELPRLIMS